jgi:hypothetical protein
MTRSGIGITAVALVMAGAGLLLAAPASAQSVMQQCGQQYQAAKAANTLNGQTWNQFRTECAARLKAQPAVAPAAAAPTPATPAAASNPLKPAPAAAVPAAPAPAAAAPAAPAATAPATTAEKPAKALSPGRAAFVARERQCGTEWKANKVTLKAQTPGLTWPKYLSQCNARLKAAGQ